MVIIDWGLFLFSLLFFTAGIFIIFCCVVGMYRNKDIFVRMHAIKISNIYGLTCLLLTEVFNADNFLIGLQLMVVLLINILSTLTIVHVVSRWVMNKKVETSSINRRKYNEMQTQKGEVGE